MNVGVNFSDELLFYDISGDLLFIILKITIMPILIGPSPTEIPFLQMQSVKQLISVDITTRLATPGLIFILLLIALGKVEVVTLKILR